MEHRRPLVLVASLGLTVGLVGFALMAQGSSIPSTGDDSAATVPADRASTTAVAIAQTSTAARLPMATSTSAPTAPATPARLPSATTAASALPTSRGDSISVTVNGDLPELAGPASLYIFGTSEQSVIEARLAKVVQAFAIKGEMMRTGSCRVRRCDVEYSMTDDSHVLTATSMGWAVDLHAAVSPTDPVTLMTAMGYDPTHYDVQSGPTGRRAFLKVDGWTTELSMTLDASHIDGLIVEPYPVSSTRASTAYGLSQLRAGEVLSVRYQDGTVELDPDVPRQLTIVAAEPVVAWLAFPEAAFALVPAIAFVTDDASRHVVAAWDSSSADFDVGPWGASTSGEDEGAAAAVGGEPPTTA